MNSAAAMNPLRSTGRASAAIETAGAWLLAIVWILPLAYALWAAIHPLSLIHI